MIIYPKPYSIYLRGIIGPKQNALNPDLKSELQVSILFGDTMVPNIESDSILLLGYSILYKEYNLTRFNHPKKTLLKRVWLCSLCWLTLILMSYQLVQNPSALTFSIGASRMI